MQIFLYSRLVYGIAHKSCILYRIRRGGLGGGGWPLLPLGRCCCGLSIGGSLLTLGYTGTVWLWVLGSSLGAGRVGGLIVADRVGPVACLGSRCRRKSSLRRGALGVGGIPGRRAAGWLGIMTVASLRCGAFCVSSIPGRRGAWSAGWLWGDAAGRGPCGAFPRGSCECTVRPSQSIRTMSCYLDLLWLMC
jgi:hypothetical protein